MIYFPYMKKVLVATTISGVAGRNCLSGIFDYVNRGKDWSISFMQGAGDIDEGMVNAALQNGVDGIIVAFGRKTAAFELLLSTGLPVVQIENPDNDTKVKRSRFALIQNDDVEVGITAANHLRGIGTFRSYTFVPTPQRTAWSLLRERGFRTKLMESGIQVRTFRPEHADLTQFLKTLDQPAAVFCATDLEAAGVLSACKKLKIKVPGQFAVIGVDDDELICGMTRPTLTSIRTDDAGLGRHAAMELDRMMNGRKPSSVPVKLPPVGVSDRDSTRTIPPAAHLIRRAIEIINSEYSDGITPADVARRLGVSESLLRLRFRTMNRKSVRDELCDVRIAAAMKLLSRTTEPVSRIASHCGFSSAAVFSHAFCKRTGVSPLRWRSTR